MGEADEALPGKEKEALSGPKPALRPFQAREEARLSLGGNVGE